MYVLRSDGLSGAEDLSAYLQADLDEGKKILWLVSGGSNIAYCVRAMDNLSRKHAKQLTVMLIDERYGPVGHADSNWKQLMDAGFDCYKTNCIPVLEEGLNFDQTTVAFATKVAQELKGSDKVVAQLGIGPDGHTAGILPDSPAAREKQALVLGYEAAPYQRVTMTFPALAQIDTAFVFAFGESKHQALSELISRDISPVKQPSQILKRIPEVYLYNDQV